MGKKHLSLIIVPHTKTSHRTLSFSKRSIRAVTGLGIGLAVLLTGITVDYVRIRLSGQSYQVLKAENAKQKDRIREYDAKVGSLEKKIASFQEYTGKLNIFAGIKSPEMLANPGVGGSSFAGEPESQPGEGQLSQSPLRSIPNVQSLNLKADDIEKNLNMLLAHFEQLQGQFATRPSIIPANGYRSSGFGYRLDPFTGERTFHSGLDISTVYGNPVIATADGSVIRVAYDGSFGNNIIINHGNGITTLYGHLSKTSVRAGQTIKRGDTIGLVGHTGRALGDHVHYEVRINGKPVNPNSYILTEF